MSIGTIGLGVAIMSMLVYIELSCKEYEKEREKFENE